ncbi:TPA: ash family protein [Pseudomonas aeruginosa]|nr:ash family protein [Pseudomonas aeruginosa]
MLSYCFSMVGRAGQAFAWPVPLVPGCHPRAVHHQSA